MYKLILELQMKIRKMFKKQGGIKSLPEATKQN
jgi:hypothetical protein